MSNSKIMVLRVQTPEGMKRINASPQDSLRAVYEKVYSAFSLQAFTFALYRDRNMTDELVSSKSITVLSSGLKHGDIVYLKPDDGANLFNASTSSTTSETKNGPNLAFPSTSSFARGESQPSGSSTAQSTPSGQKYYNAVNDISEGAIINYSVIEDEVDRILWGTEGKVQRQRDRKLCHHGSNGCCVHCSPLEPYDEAYLREQNIKHLSFHSYLRKLTGGVDRGKFVALENTSCRIKPGCKDHPPWPKGICSKCQPSAITLNRQTFRHVDNVMFENPEIVERFLEYWRISGHQRWGYLYGRYEVHADVPLGIRATVAAIYEPPQETSRDRIVMLPDPREDTVNQIAQQLGLVKVGWIFTDLIAEDVAKGTVKHVRNINTHFLSAQECITAGHLQNLHPNPCKLSSTGYFGSKFTTVCVTGDEKNQVHMEGYAVSSQCMSLVRDQCLVPTRDKPQLGFVPESTDRQYVPDVYYKEKDSYGNEVSKLARPLPVEYLLVDVPVSTPLTPVYTFRSDPRKTPFVVENRLLDRHIQDFNAFSHYFHQFSREEFLAAVSDFHVLIYMATMEMLPLKEYMGPLLKAVKERNASAAAEWAKSEHWGTVEQLMASSRESGAGRSGHSGGGSASLMDSQSEWTCPHCTFLNFPHLSQCDMCSLPR